MFKNRVLGKESIFSRTELETWQANSLEEGTLGSVSAEDQVLKYCPIVVILIFKTSPTGRNGISLIS